jgi:hypothetical protein
MFKPTDARRDVWFNPSCTFAGDEYTLVGVLVGLAIYNATLLDLHLPRAVYKKLLDIPVCVCWFVGFGVWEDKGKGGGACIRSAVLSNPTFLPKTNDGTNRVNH